MAMVGTTTMATGTVRLIPVVLVGQVGVVTVIATVLIIIVAAHTTALLTVVEVRLPLPPMTTTQPSTAQQVAVALTSHKVSALEALHMTWVSGHSDGDKSVGTGHASMA